jgi:octaprenyl-diphosphate synthase
VYTLWAGSLRKLHLGQAMDIHWHRNFDLIPALDEYHTMCKLKTGSLARFAAELGAAAAEIFRKVPVEAGELGGAAEKIGVGFQILDDVKNLTSGIPGKKRGDDIVEEKKSLPVLLFLYRFPEKREMVSRCFNAAHSSGVYVPEVEELIQALLATGVICEAEEQAKTLIAEARKVFAVPSDNIMLLNGLIDLIT